MTSRVMRVAGADGCRAGWVVATASVGAHTDGLLEPEMRVERTFDAAVAHADLVLVDIPIGLLDAAAPGGRPCDIAARQLLGARASSVFSPPVRGVLAVEGYEEALAVSRASSGHALGLSKQTWNIVPKIREVDGWIDPLRQGRVRECHPEVVFACLAPRRASGRDGEIESKKTAAGRATRLELLRRGGVRAPEDVNELIRVAGAQADDILDAMACLVAAMRVARGAARVLGGELDGRGLRMEIVA